MENIMRALSIFNLSRAIEGANRVTRTLVFRDRDANLCSAKLGKNAREKLLLFSGRTEGGGGEHDKNLPSDIVSQICPMIGKLWSEIRRTEWNQTERETEREIT